MKPPLLSLALCKSPRKWIPAYASLSTLASRPAHDPDNPRFEPDGLGFESFAETVSRERILLGIRRFHYKAGEQHNLQKFSEASGADTCDLTVCTTGRIPRARERSKQLGNIVAQTQKPNDHSVSSTLKYMYALSKGMVEAELSAQHAMVKLLSTRSALSPHWSLECITPRRNVKDPTSGFPTFVFTLEMRLKGFYSTLSKIPLISLDLYMQPRGRSILASTEVSATNTRAPVDMDQTTASHFAKSLSHGLNKNLDDRKFTSSVSLAEAVFRCVEDIFPRLPLNQDFSIVDIQARTAIYARYGASGMKVYRRYQRTPVFVSKRQEYKGAHAKDGSLSLDSDSATKTAHPSRHMAGYSEISVSMARDENIQSLGSTDETSDPSAIARLFEDQCKTSFSQGVQSLINVFQTVSEELSAHAAKRLVISVRCHVSPFDLANRGDQVRSLDEPSHRVVLSRGVAANSTNASIHLEVDESYLAGFNQVNRKNCPIQVKYISLKVAPIDTADSRVEVPSNSNSVLSLQQEIRHLTKSTSDIMKKVCDGVKFDDITAVPDLLAEAVLRVVRPLTVSLKIEKVSLGALIGDDPLIWEKTVSLESLAAKHIPDLGVIPQLPYQLPPQTNLHIAAMGKFIHAPKAIFRKTGYPSVSAFIILSPCTEDQMKKSKFDATGSVVKVLDTLGSGDLFGLKESVCKGTEMVPAGKEIRVILKAMSGQPWRAPQMSSVEISSRGRISCTLPMLTNLSVGLENTCQGKLIPVCVRVILRGNTDRVMRSDLTARQQVERMHEIIATQLSAKVNGLIFRDEDEFGHKALQAIHGAEDALAEHINITHSSVSADFEKALAASSDQGNDTVNGLQDEEYIDSDGEHETSMDYSDATGSERISSIAEGQQESLTRTIVPMDHGDEESTTLRALIQQLDHQLMSINSPALALQLLIGDLDSRLTSFQSTSPKIANNADDGTHLEKANPPVQARRPMERGVVIALGSNIGNKIEEIEKACRAIDNDPDMRIVDTSCLYETKPMYVEDQDTFVNGACEIETSLSPIELLDRLQAIEQGHGRVKLVDKGPRNIDLDIAIFRDEIVDSERLTVPHLLMHEREFVLRPIMDLKQLSDWKNPRGGMSVYNMFDKLTRSGTFTSGMYTSTPLTTDMCLHTTMPTKRTHVMSILNTTPDSFSDGGSNALDPQSLRETAAAHIAAGATIIDVGGQSSRPNAPDVTAEEEIARVLPAISAIRSLPEAKGIAISVDTYRAAVAEAAVLAGADIVNDISAGLLDPQMIPTVARLGCTYIMMHMRGTPATMQSPENCSYPQGFYNALAIELNERVGVAMEAGIRRWRLILDPGVGFAKEAEHNLRILADGKIPNGKNRASLLNRMPLLIGSSRKGFIGNITGVTSPRERIWGTAAAVTSSICGGADIVRVHDVSEMVQVAKMADAIYRREGKARAEQRKADRRIFGR